MYEGKHRHIVDAIVEVSETTRITASDDLSTFEIDELWTVVRAFSEERHKLEDRDAIFEMAMIPFIEELKERGEKHLKISRVMRRGGEADPSMVTRILDKWRGLIVDIEALESGATVTNRRNRRLFTVVQAAVEESKTISMDQRNLPEVRNQARTHGQLVDAWWRRMLKSASNQALALPLGVIGLFGVKVGAGGAAASSSAPAVSGGIFGLSVTTQVAAGATALVVATTVVVASEPVQNEPAPPGSIVAVQQDRIRRPDGRGSYPIATRPQYPLDMGLPSTLPTGPEPSTTPTPSPTPTPTPTPTPSVTPAPPEEVSPEESLLALSPATTRATQPPTSAPAPTPSSSATKATEVKKSEPTKAPAEPVVTLTPTKSAETSPGPTPIMSAAQPTPAPSEAPQGGDGEPTVAPSGISSNTSEPPPAIQTTAPEPSGLLSDLLHIATTIL